MNRERKLFSLLFELLIFNVAFAVTNEIIFDSLWVDGWGYPSLWVAMNISIVLSFFLSSQHKEFKAQTYYQVFLNTIEYFITVSFFILIYWFIVDLDRYYKVHISLFLFLSFLLIILYKILFQKYLRQRNGGFVLENIVIIGNSSFSKELKAFIQKNTWLGMNVCDDTIFEFAINQKKEDVFINKRVKQVYINISDYFLDESVYQFCKKLNENHLIDFKTFSPHYFNRFKNNDYLKINNISIINLFEYPLDKGFNQIIKRIFDFIGAMSFIVIIGVWLFPLIILFIVLDSKGGAIFKQKRSGNNNKEFVCYKFRSMRIHKDKVVKQATKNDDRITRVGKFLRKSNLDELPQVFNILIGDMSIVGPRPHAVVHNEEYEKLIDKYNFRHSVKPGLTGLAQVKGCRGETETVEKMQKRIDYDRFYINNWTFGLDLRICFLTIKNMLMGEENAY